MATMLSQYLRAERVDRSEPVDFYAPGATRWDDPWLGKYLRERVENEPFEADDEVDYEALTH